MPRLGKRQAAPFITRSATADARLIFMTTSGTASGTGSCRRRGRCLPIVPPYTMMPGRLSRAKPTSLAAAMLSLVPRSSRCMLHGLLSHHTEPAAADLRLSQRVCAK